MNKWTLINYFDVWGNEEEGWEVNNACSEFDDLEIADDATDQDIIDYLYNIEFFRTNDLEKFRIEDMGDGFIEIYQAEDNKPLCRLQRNQ